MFRKLGVSYMEADFSQNWLDTTEYIIVEIMSNHIWPPSADFADSVESLLTVYKLSADSLVTLFTLVCFIC